MRTVRNGGRGNLTAYIEVEFTSLSRYAMPALTRLWVDSRGANCVGGDTEDHATFIDLSAIHVASRAMCDKIIYRLRRQQLAERSFVFGVVKRAQSE